MTSQKTTAKSDIRGVPIGVAGLTFGSQIWYPNCPACSPCPVIDGSCPVIDGSCHYEHAVCEGLQHGYGNRPFCGSLVARKLCPLVLEGVVSGESP